MKLEQKIPPLILVVIFATCMFFTAKACIDFTLFYSFNLVALLIFLFIGLLFILSGVVAFKKHKTTVNPVNTDNVSTLVNSGIYKYTRNPMYVGMLSVLIGYVIYLANPLNVIFIALFILYMNKYQISPEEEFLSKLFGSSYISYSRKVRRWL